jgi:hypothetical protein
MKQVNLELEDELHRRLKHRAVDENVTLGELVTALLEVGLRWMGKEGKKQ